MCRAGCEPAAGAVLRTLAACRESALGLPGVDPMVASVFVPSDDEILHLVGV